LKTQRLKTRAPTHVIPMPENSGLSRNNQFGNSGEIQDSRGRAICY